MNPFRRALFSLLMLLPSCKPPTPPPDDGDCTSSICVLVRDAGNPDWSPTGERFAFLRIADSMLCLYYFADKHIEPLTNGEEPDFSPDGKRLAFEWRRRIYVIDIETRAITDIAAGVAPAWSENGLWIAFAHPTSFKRKHTGEMIDGEPNPDSSLLMYDVQTQSIDRIVIENLNPPTGPEVGITYPTWVLKDSFIVFATEPQMAAVNRGGGGWQYIHRLPSPESVAQVALAKNQQIRKGTEVFLGAGRSSWNRELNQLLFEYGENAFPSGVDCGLYRMDFGSRWGVFFSSPNQTDPSWKVDATGSRIYVSDGFVQVWRR